MKGGADITPEPDIDTALYSASDYGGLYISMHLVLNSPDTNAQTRKDNALQSASASGDLRCVRFLLEQGAYIDARIV